MIKEFFTSKIKRVRDFMSRKDHKFEDKLKEMAVYSPDQWDVVDVESLLSEYEYEQIGMGLNSRIFRLKDMGWVVKEGRWDLSMELFRGVHIPLPAKLIQWILKLFKYLFLPDQEQIQNDFNDYLIAANYLGFFEYEDDFPNPKREGMFKRQSEIRASLLEYREKIEKKYGFEFEDNIVDILQDEELVKHNFLPREYMLIGKGISPQNNSKITYYIFQEFIEGRELYEVNYDELSSELKKQLILMIYLILVMHFETSLTPDTRPKYWAVQVHNWLTLTDNIIVGDNEQIKFIDTRWFWDSKANWIKRGLVIPLMIRKRAKKEINILLREMKKENN